MPRKTRLFRRRAEISLSEKADLGRGLLQDFFYRRNSKQPCLSCSWLILITYRRFELLISGVQHAEEADLRATVGEGRKLPRQSKNHVRVARGQKVFSARFQPAVTRVRLAFRQCRLRHELNEMA